MRRRNRFVRAAAVGLLPLTTVFVATLVRDNVTAGEVATAAILAAVIVLVAALASYRRS